MAEETVKKHCHNTNTHDGKKNKGKIFLTQEDDVLKGGEKNKMLTAVP